MNTNVSGDVFGYDFIPVKLMTFSLAPVELRV